MGTSGECNTKSIDASVGGLVWVQRRNGSWWPGRIMGLDELSDDSLVSPKSGTPLKLLGREDANVDWYNLEKSKRVKAFRCGEYDECIEKAKASAANSSKKSVKYARREDAILHALEIENGFLSEDHPDFFTRTENANGEDRGGWAGESLIVSHSSKENEDMTEEVSTFEDNSNTTLELSQSGLSFEEPNQINPSKVQSVRGKRRRTPNDSEDDGTERIMRMRGLEDLGIGVVTKRKSQAGGDLDLVQQDMTSACDANTANRSSSRSHLNGSKGDFLSLRGKRSQVANLHEFFKRKKRRRPLTKVLESTALVSVPIMCGELAKVSGLETYDFKRIFPVVVNNSSESTGTSCENRVSFNVAEAVCDASHVHYKIKDKEILSTSNLVENSFSETLFDVPVVGDESHPAGLLPMYSSCSSGKPQAGDVKRQFYHGSRAETVFLKNEGPIESGSTSSAAAHSGTISQVMEKGTSKWESKRKRKSRHTQKSKKRDLRKFVDMADIERRNGFSLGSVGMVDCGVIGDPLASESCTLQVKSREITENLVYGLHHVSCREPHLMGQIYELKLPPDCSMTPQKLLPYRQSRYTVHPKYQSPDFPLQNYCADSLLYDVNLKVKASYCPQHVPLVSLMSKLNGKAIVGHPLTVEALTGGSWDYPMDGGRCYLPSSSSDLNDSLSGGMSDLEGAEMGCADIKKMHTKHASMRTKHASMRTKHASMRTKHASMRTHSSPSKLLKLRKCGFMSKKTRKLSSLTGSRMQSKEEKKLVVEKPEGPVISCIPLKVVFNRINEALNGSTTGPAHGY